MRIATLNLYDSPISLSYKSNKADVISKLISSKNIDLFFLQEHFHTRFNIQYVYPTFTYYNFKGGLSVISNFQISYEFRKFYNQSTLLSPLTLTDSLVNKGFAVIKANGIVFINTHIVCPYFNNSHELKLQEAQLNQISEYLINIDGPVVVIGDFNMNSKNDLFKRFTKSNNLSDASYLVGNTLDNSNTNRGPLHNLLFSHLNNTQFDHILTRDINICNVQLAFNELYNGKNISDHFGLIADIK